MHAPNRTSSILIIVLAATGSWAYGAQPPDVVDSDGDGNTAMGSSALASLTVGLANTASGVLALENLTGGSYNTALGAYALQNTTTGNYNTATGESALAVNSTGAWNTASGVNALWSNTSGSYNTASGASAMWSNATGSYNTASGYQALYSNTTGNRGVAVGSGALYANTVGNYDNAVGAGALGNNTSGSYNVGVGTSALNYNTSGNYNSALGDYGLYDNISGGYNNAQGYGALYHNTTGAYNAGIGVYALFANSTGSNNIAVGQLAGYYVTGSNNIEIGSRGTAADEDVIRIGSPNVQGSAYIAGVYNANVTGGATVVVNSSGQLGVMSSSRRYKEDIRSMGDASDRLLELRPVTFRYKKADENGQKPEQYGLIAEEVATVMPELVVYNDKGEAETVAYQALTPLLLNELQREHKRAERQAQDLRDARRELAILKDRLDAFEARRAVANPGRLLKTDQGRAGTTSVAEFSAAMDTRR